MEKILNLTQHLATPEQMAQGVVDLSERDRKALVLKEKSGKRKNISGNWFKKIERIS